MAGSGPGFRKRGSLTCRILWAVYVKPEQKLRLFVVVKMQAVSDGRHP